MTTATPITDIVDEFVPKPIPKLARRLRTKAPEIPVENPLVELRRVASMHRDLKRTETRFRSSISDRTNRTTGEIIPCTKSPEVILDVTTACDRMRKESESLVRKMGKLLQGMPIYDEFLSKVPGLGAVTAAYLVTMIRIERANTVSQLIRYCGFGTDTATGKSERRSGAPIYKPDGTKSEGATGTFNQDLKIALVVCFKMMRQSCGKDRATNRYLKRWDDAKHTSQCQRGTTGKSDGFADDKGRRKATDLFLWDLYVMWRTLAGLPIRPDKYSAIRGRYHDGTEARDALYNLTLDEARAMVGVQ